METGQKIIQQKTKIDELSSKILSIQVSLNGLSFCMLNEHGNVLEYVFTKRFERRLNPQDLLKEMKAIFELEPSLDQTVNNVKVVYQNDLSTIVPKPFFNEDHLADYLKFNARILQTDYITYDLIESNDSVVVYVPYVNINNYLFDRYGDFEYRHHSALLINSLLVHGKNAMKEKMFIHINEHQFDIVVIDKSTLKLFNTFDYSSKEDFIYYILFAAEQLELNPETIELVLLGDIHKESELFEIAYKYVRHVAIFDYDYKFNFAEDIDQTSAEKQYLLLNNL